MELLKLTPDLYDEYRVFLQGREEAMLYYGLPYQDFLVDMLGCRSETVVARRDERITGALPLMACDGPWGTVVNSLPYYGSNGGVLAEGQDEVNALFEQYNRIVTAEGVLAATLVEHPLHPADPDCIAHTLQDSRIGQLTTLPTGAGEQALDTLLGSFEGSARRNVKKANRLGVTVEVQNDAFDFLERVHKENMEAMGGNAKSHRFFESVPGHFKPDEEYRIYVASLDGEPAAALLLFYFNATVEYFTPVVVERAREVQPMAALLSRAMHDAAIDGYRWWNWGGTWLVQDGVYRFKRKWAAEDHPYRYFIQVNDNSIFDRSALELLGAYPNFFTVPFGRLNSSKEANA